MKQVFTKYLKKLIILTVIIVILGFVIKIIIPTSYFTPAFFFIIFFFFFITAGAHYTLLRVSEKRFSRFASFFMIATFLKLMIYIIILLLYIFINKDDAIPFIITFFIIYVAFTAFEVVSMLLHHPSNEKNLE